MIPDTCRASRGLRASLGLPLVWLRRLVSEQEDLKNCAARAVAERARADAATSPEIATAHRKMAELYEQRVRSIDGALRNHDAPD